MKYLIGFILFVIAGCSTLPNAEKIQTEFGVFTYYLAGSHKPTVFFESGLGDDMTSWEAVVEQAEKFSQVFAYNRSGFSGSNSQNITRDGEVIVKELRSLLKSLKLKPPYVLVGHSLGGGYMELYTRTYPDEVSGLVLVDPNSSKYPTRCKQEQLGYCEPPSGMPYWATFFFPDAVESEIKGFQHTHQQINVIDNFPNVPLVVLSATNKKQAETALEKRRNELYVEM